MAIDKDNPDGEYVCKLWGSRPARKTTLHDPSVLWNLAVNYFEWVEKNPLFKEVMSQGQPVQTVKPRAMTIEGLCRHAGFTRQTWKDCKSEWPEFADTVDAIECVLYEQNFVNAAADNMNAGLITRALNLADKKEISGPSGGKIEGGFTFVGVGPEDD